MTKLIIYINDNEIQIIKDKIITFTSPSINNSNIIEETIFIKDFKKFLKDHKLISSIIYYPINIYLNYQVLPKDIVYYNYLFDKLNLTLNKVLCINDLLDKDNNKESIVMYLVCISFFKISLLFNIKSVHLPSDNLI